MVTDGARVEATVDAAIDDEGNAWGVKLKQSALMAV